MTLGDTGWTAEGMHPHHAFGTSQVWGGVDCNCLIRALGAHLDHPESRPTQGMARGICPQSKCT